jgi:hypothetical protein
MKNESNNSKAVEKDPWWLVVLCVGGFWAIFIGMGMLGSMMVKDIAENGPRIGNHDKAN